MNVFTPSVLAAIRRQTTENAAMVTVLVGATMIAEIDLGLVVPGQIIFASWQVDCTKGGVSGDTSIGVVKSGGGAGVIEFGPSLLGFANSMPDHLAGIVWFASGVAVGLVTAAGQYTLRLFGGSAGSNSTVLAGAGNLSALIITR